MRSGRFHTPMVDFIAHPPTAATYAPTFSRGVSTPGRAVILACWADVFFADFSGYPSVHPSTLSRSVDGLFTPGVWGRAVGSERVIIRHDAAIAKGTENGS
ncbi:hypothetical protein LIA77_08965 [Sarocladium implicatum]|nr:hypothetical protein LIA77_08965 [Sarocladium implicatum]